MLSDVMKRMSGEELLLLRIISGNRVAPEIEHELDRRALLGPMRQVVVRRRSVSKRLVHPAAVAA